MVLPTAAAVSSRGPADDNTQNEDLALAGKISSNSLSGDRTGSTAICSRPARRLTSAQEAFGGIRPGHGRLPDGRQSNAPCRTETPGMAGRGPDSAACRVPSGQAPPVPRHLLTGRSLRPVPTRARQYRTTIGRMVPPAPRRSAFRSPAGLRNHSVRRSPCIVIDSDNILRSGHIPGAPITRHGHRVLSGTPA